MTDLEMTKLCAEAICACMRTGLTSASGHRFTVELAD
jgi:hypothetical protein